MGAPLWRRAVPQTCDRGAGGSGRPARRPEIRTGHKRDTPARKCRSTKAFWPVSPALGGRIEPQGLHLLETPISGTSEQVREGRGVALVGGDPAKLARVANILGAIFPSHFYMGPIGQASRAKLAINLILGLNRLALAEGLVFAERMQLEPARFLEIARQAASYSQVMDTKGPKMLRGDFLPEGRARQALKDVQLILAQAHKVGQDLPLATLNAQILEACVRNGEGDQDNSVVIREIRRRAAGAPE